MISMYTYVAYGVQQMSMAQATVIATKFLEQYHSNVQLKEIVLDGDVYLVTLETGLLEKKTMQVKVDAKTSKIIKINIQKIL